MTPEEIQRQKAKVLADEKRAQAEVRRMERAARDRAIKSGRATPDQINQAKEDLLEEARLEQAAANESQERDETDTESAVDSSDRWHAVQHPRQPKASPIEKFRSAGVTMIIIGLVIIGISLMAYCLYLLEAFRPNSAEVILATVQSLLGVIIGGITLIAGSIFLASSLIAKTAKTNCS
jgi:hypothetical protein